MLIWRTFISLLLVLTPILGSVAQERADRRPPLAAGLASSLAAKFEKLEQHVKARHAASRIARRCCKSIRSTSRPRRGWGRVT